MAPKMDHEETVNRVLQLLVEHWPGLDFDIKTVCSLLLLSKGCRRALLQADGRLCFAYKPGPSSLTRVAGFASWLPDHANLIRSIRLATRYCDGRDMEVIAVEQLLALAIKFSSKPKQMTATAVAASSPFAPPMLRLNSFRTVRNLSEPIVDALVSAQLQHLDIRGHQYLLEPLARLSSLQALKLQVVPDDTGPLLAAISDLQLTLLDLEEVQSHSDMSALPKTLKVLGLTFSDVVPCSIDRDNSPARWTAETSTWKLDLSHLSALQDLDLHADGVGQGSALPSQLASLTTSASLENLGVGALERLQQAVVYNFQDDVSMLQCLAALPNLHALELLYWHKAKALLDAAPFLEGIHQLRALHITAQLQWQELELVMECIARTTSIERLRLEDMPLDANAVLSSALPQLPKLRRLELVNVDFEQGGAIRILTSLTALSHLELHGLGSLVDDITGTSVAFRLKNLRKLYMTDCGLRSPSLLPVFGGMKCLEALDLSGNCMDISRIALLQLTSLTKLKSLWLPEGSVSDRDAQELMAALPELQCCRYD